MCGPNPSACFNYKFELHGVYQTYVLVQYQGITRFVKVTVKVCVHVLEVPQTSAMVTVSVNTEFGKVAVMAAVDEIWAAK